MDTDELTQRIPPEIVADLVSLAWQTFVGSELIPVETGGTIDADKMVSSAISIGGPWSATVVLHCSRTLARDGAAAVLGMEPLELEDSDVLDIVGELANIIGGNVKGFVSDADSEWSLSLPVVSEGMQSVPGSRLATEVAFLCEGEPISCEVREHA